MENLFVISLVIAIIYVIIRSVENNTMDVPRKPLKVLFRDGFIVFISALLGIFTYDQISQLTGNSSSSDVSKVFTNTPDF